MFSLDSHSCWQNVGYLVLFYLWTKTEQFLLVYVNSYLAMLVRIYLVTVILNQLSRLNARRSLRGTADVSHGSVCKVRKLNWTQNTLQLIDLELEPRFTSINFHSSTSGEEAGSQSRATRDKVSGSSILAFKSYWISNSAKGTSQGQRRCSSAWRNHRSCWWPVVKITLFLRHVVIAIPRGSRSTTARQGSYSSHMIS